METSATWLLFNSFQEEGCAYKSDQDAETKRDQIDREVGKAGAIEIHEAKSATEMCQRKELGEIANGARQLVERGKSAGQNKNGKEKENRKLNGLGLCA
jgi:hypothetical protein